MSFTSAIIKTSPSDELRAPRVDHVILRRAAVPGAMKKYHDFDKAERLRRTGSSAINWNDLRIREYIPSEVEINENFMKHVENLDLATIAYKVSSNSLGNILCRVDILVAL